MVDVSSIPEIQESFCVQYQSEEEILIYFFNTLYLHIFHLRSNAELCFFFFLKFCCMWKILYKAKGVIDDYEHFNSACTFYKIFLTKNSITKVYNIQNVATCKG